MTFDEMLEENRDYQGEFDRRVQKGIETARANWEKEAEKRQAEAVRLAGMSAEEKQNEALRRANERAELLEREKSAILLKQMAMDELSRREMPRAIGEYVTGDDEDSTMERIEAFCGMFNDALASELKKRTGGYTPMSGEGGGDLFLSGFENG